MDALVIDGLSKTYRDRKRRTVEALKNLSLSIPEGEVFGFLGPNGAGKSTTIKCLVGLVRPTGGSATIMGEPAGSARSRMRVGYLPENPAFYDFLSAEEYLRFVGECFRVPRETLKRRVEEVLGLLDLSGARRRPIRSYSKGMVQRVGIAQVLVHDPDLYILDEPMSGLDPVGRALVKEIIRGLKGKGKTVFFSTHITDDVEKVCDRVGILVGGELRLIERVDTVMVEGIVGYQVRTRSPGGETVDELVPRGGVERYLSERTSAGFEVLVVEPRRRTLEDLFLSLVQRGEGA